mmetsp:Transcript_53060/g.95512  ORF Transcript_53060/g.95512 Transcript_53060/m.95512 type:complete len:204 (+) Transcript_53060:313-924(+)
MQAFLRCFLRCLWILRVKDAGTIGIDCWPVGTQRALDAGLGEGGNLEVAEALHSYPALPSAANEAVRIRRLQLAGLKDLFPRRLRIPHPDSPCQGVTLAYRSCGEHMHQLRHLKTGNDGVGTGHRRDDGAGDGLSIPSRDARDAVVLHAQVGRMMHEIHGHRVVLAEDALSDGGTTLRAEHGRHRSNEALGICSHCWHLLRLQ